MIIPNIWGKKKGSKPPTSKPIYQKQDDISRWGFCGAVPTHMADIRCSCHFQAKKSPKNDTVKIGCTLHSCILIVIMALFWMVCNWGFPSMGVSKMVGLWYGKSQMDDLGVPLFQETTNSSYQNLEFPFEFVFVGGMWNLRSCIQPAPFTSEAATSPSRIFFLPC